MNVLGMFVKHPHPGQVKTRLAAEIGAEAAATLYEAFIADLADRFRNAADRRFLCFTPHDPVTAVYFRNVGQAEYELWPQPDQSLGERMAAFLADHLEGPLDRVAIIGSDIPTLPLAVVEQAFELLHHHDCVLGPATDGGFYLVGQRPPFRDLFADVEWSSPQVLEQTVRQVERCGASLALLPVWYDVDTAADLDMLRGHIAALQIGGAATAAEHTRKLLEGERDDEITR